MFVAAIGEFPIKRFDHVLPVFPTIRTDEKTPAIVCRTPVSKFQTQLAAMLNEILPIRLPLRLKKGFYMTQNVILTV